MRPLIASQDHRTQPHPLESERDYFERLARNARRDLRRDRVRSALRRLTRRAARRRPR